MVFIVRNVLTFLQRGFWRKLVIAVFCCVALFAKTSQIAFGSNAQSAAGEPNFSLQPVVNGHSPTAGDATCGKNQVQISVQQRFVVPIVLILPGPQSEELVATGIQPSSGPGYQNLLIALSNTGTVRLKPHGNVQVSDVQGHPLRNLSMNLDTFLPRTSIDYSLYIQNEALAVGTYQAVLTLSYGHNHVLRYKTTFTITAQQLQKISGPPLKVPPFSSSSLPLWLLSLLAVLADLVASGLSILFTWRMAIRTVKGSGNTPAGSRRPRKRKRSMIHSCSTAPGNSVGSM